MRILSGIQPSGLLHLGNYFGMMRPAIALQQEGEAFYFIADYHALTSLRDPAALRRHTRQVALDFLACGLDPARAALFRQSDVPEVTELAWILSTVTPMSRLELAHSYKDKVARGVAANAGLFTYPVLMAADILIYDSDVVPVGRDQKQHLEITRDIASRLNEAFGDVLKLPEPRINAATETVPGLDGQKMSKSYGNTIDLFGEEKETRKRVMSIVTDSAPVESPKNPEGSTLVQLYSLFATRRRDGGNAGLVPTRRDRLRRLQEATFRPALGVFCPDAGSPGRAGEGAGATGCHPGRGGRTGPGRGFGGDGTGPAGGRAALNQGSPVAPSNWKTSSRGRSKACAIRKASSSEGKYFAASTAMIVCRVTPTVSASFCCVISPVSKRRRLIWLLMRSFSILAAAPKANHLHQIPGHLRHDRGQEPDLAQKDRVQKIARQGFGRDNPGHDDRHRPDNKDR